MIQYSTCFGQDFLYYFLLCFSGLFDTCDEIIDMIHQAGDGDGVRYSVVPLLIQHSLTLASLA